MAMDRFKLLAGLGCLLVALALGATTLFRAQVSTPSNAPPAQMTAAPVSVAVTAAKDIRRGDKITPDMLSSLKLASRRPSGSFARDEDVVGAIALIDIKAHQLVLATALLRQADARPGLSVLVPAGKRAVALRVNDEVAVGNFIRPDDRVDIELVIPADQRAKIQGKTVVGAGDPESRILLEDIAVLSVGEALAVDKNDKAIRMQNVTVAVTPQQALQIAVAKEVGQFYLSLRHPADDGPAKTGTITARELFGPSRTSQSAPPASPVARRAVPSESRRVPVVQGLKESYQVVE